MSRFLCCLVVLVCASLRINFLNSFPISDDKISKEWESIFDVDKETSDDDVIAIGDMRFTKHDFDIQNGLINERYRWPNRTVYYTIDPKFNETEVKLLHNSFDEYHNRTCIKWVKRTDQRDYVAIRNGARGCYSYLGRRGGAQILNMASSCFRRHQPGVATHEMLHALGFFHEQSRTDRDKYVRILWENIIPGTEGNFAKVSNKTATDFGVPYDYGSIMHYPAYGFSKNGKKTIETLVEAEIGKIFNMTKSDILKLQRMYKCDEQNN